jgi:hypothetical protein
VAVVAGQVKPRLRHVHEEPGQQLLAVEGLAVAARSLLVPVPSDGAIEFDRARVRGVREKAVDGGGTRYGTTCSRPVQIRDGGRHKYYSSPRAGIQFQ